MSNLRNKSHTHIPGQHCSICNSTIKKDPGKKDIQSSQPTQNRNVTKNTIEELRHKVTDVIGKNPDKAGKILSDWLNSAETRKPSKKKSA